MGSDLPLEPIRETAALDNQGYHRFTGTLTAKRRWLPIFLFGLECTLRARLTIAMIVLCWVVVIMQTVFFFVLTQGQLLEPKALEDLGRDPTIQEPAIDPMLLKVQGNRFFTRTMLDLTYHQLPWLVILLALVGSGVIANDLAKGAHQIYFARPISRNDYLVGKTLVLFFYIFVVLWLPILFFWSNCYYLSGQTQSPNWQQIIEDITWVRLGESVCYLAIITLSLITLLLMLSSLSKHAKFIGLTFVSIFIMGWALEWLVSRFRGLSPLRYLSYPADLNKLGYAFFHFRVSSWNEVYGIAGVLIVCGMICLSIFYWRLGKILLGKV